MLQYKLDSLEGLDDSIKNLYQEKDGAFYLQVGGVVPEDELAGIKANRDALLAEKKAESERRKQAEEQARLAAEEAARQNGDIASLDKSYQEKIAQMQEQLAQSTGTIHKLTVGQTALATAVELAVDGSHELILPFIENRLKLDENGQVRVLDKSGALSALTIEDLKNELRNTASFKPVLKAQGGSGGGASGDLGGGAVDKKPNEYTEQELRDLKARDPQKFYSIINNRG